jgi:replicative DNA helicase
VANIRAVKEELAPSGKIISGVFVDHLGKLNHPQASRDDLAIGKTTSLFANAAKDMDVPILVLSQINRGVQNRDDKRPTMSDLSDSGKIENDADTIALVYRDEYYHPDTDDKGVAEIIIAKQRNGPTGPVRVAFENRSTTFRNLEPTYEPYKY